MTTKHEHEHEAISERGPWGYTGPVAVEPYTHQNPAAHGNVRFRETCACGYERDVLINQRHEEYSPWRESDAMREEREYRKEFRRIDDKARAVATALLARLRAVSRRVGAIRRAVAVGIPEIPGLRVEFRLDADPQDLDADDLRRADTVLLVWIGDDPTASRCTIGDVRQAARQWAGSGEPAEAIYAALAAALPPELPARPEAVR